MNDIIYSFGNRENMRKCEQQVENVFSIVFSRTQPNTKKYFSKYFWKIFYFLKMLFFEKENVFMCLVEFQKIFRKIFSGVWLCS